VLCCGDDSHEIRGCCAKIVCMTVVYDTECFVTIIKFCVIHV
jgi:hypothetical protein